MDEQRIEAAAKAMYDAVLAGAGTADDFNSRPPEVRAIWLSAARAASPHLAQDEGLHKAAQDANEALRNILNGNDLALERGQSIENWKDSHFRKQGNEAYHALKAALDALERELSQE